MSNNILLIEDDAVDVMAVKRLFKKQSIINPLYIAENGLEALAILRLQNRQLLAAFTKHLLVLLAPNLPIMNGLEFLVELQSDLNLKKIPIIVFTTLDQEKKQLEAQHSNIVGYLSKPINFLELTKLTETLNKNCRLEYDILEVSASSK
jgi:CheY-like chemotaxis protein